MYQSLGFTQARIEYREQWNSIKTEPICLHVSIAIEVFILVILILSVIEEVSLGIAQIFLLDRSLEEHFPQYNHQSASAALVPIRTKVQSLWLLHSH